MNSFCQCMECNYETGWVNIILAVKLKELLFFIAYTFKGRVHVFTGRVKIVSHLSCRTSAILKYFCPLHSDQGLPCLLL